MNGIMENQAQAALDYFDQRYKDPQQAWRKAVTMRETGGPFSAQALADAEHELWARYYATKGLPQAILGMWGPVGWSGYKVARQGLGAMGLADPMTSDPTLTQLKFGQRGAWEGLKSQLGKMWGM